MADNMRSVLHMKNLTQENLFSVNDFGERFFDFNKVIPMPPSLDIKSGTNEEDAIAAYIYSGKASAKHTEALGAYLSMKGRELPSRDRVMQKAMRLGKPLAEFVAMGEVYLDNYMKYRATTWYDWCINYWGTKWNSFDCCVMDNDTIRFTTAWTAPIPVIAKLSKKYPSRVVTLWSASEHPDEMTVFATFKRGLGTTEKHSGGSAQGAEIYAKCWRGR